MFFFFLLFFPLLTSSQSPKCRTECNGIPISYPFSIDDGCGHPSFSNLLTCTTTTTSLLSLRTPSGRYPIHHISYTDPHLILTDPSSLTCTRAPSTDSLLPFSLDSSTPLSLSHKNEFLFFNCSEEEVVVKPKPAFCTKFPERCGSECDSAAYLCRNLPGCGAELVDEMGMSCCGYYPKASESVRMMLRHCGGYANVYWKVVGENAVTSYDQVPEFGIRVEFYIPVTTRCRQCREKGNGTCGFDIITNDFLCICPQGNATTYCGDGSLKHRASAAVIAGTTVVSLAGVAGAGALIWVLRKMRPNKVVTCGVQTTENRLF